MFRWLASGALDEPDASNLDNQPDTPAHLFAARAFKYSLFGTPKPQEKNKTDVRRKDIQDQSFTCEPILSPSKPGGILLTPGTANLRRTKSVTFGAQVTDNKRTRSFQNSKSGLPETCPGRYPSPWTPKSRLDPSNRTSDLHEDLKQSKVGNVTHTTTSPNESEQKKIANDLAQGSLSSKDAQGWENKFEDYAQRTQREMKKLIAKQKAAKSYARDRDSKVIDLADRLKQEQKKVKRLEDEVFQLRTKLEQYQNDKAPAERPRSRNDAIVNDQGVSTTVPRSARRSASLTRPLLRSEQPIVSRPAFETGDLWADVMLSSPAVKITARPPTSSRKSVAGPAAELPLRTRDLNTTTGDDAMVSAKGRRVLHTTFTQGQTTSSHPQGKFDDGIEDMPDLPVPSPDHSRDIISPLHAKTSSIKKKTTPSRRSFAAESSPFMSSPPHYDRFALPFSLPSPGVRGKSTRAADGSAQETTAKPLLSENENKENLADPAKEKDPGRRLDEERRAKAAERIAARRQKRAAGVV